MSFICDFLMFQFLCEIEYILRIILYTTMNTNLSLGTLIFIKYDNNKTIYVHANTIHPAILQEIKTYGCADYMFDDGTFATLSFVERSSNDAP